MQKKFRLRDHRDFKNVYRRGKPVRGKLIDAKFVSNHQALSRVGIVVSTKVSKSAVKRNRMRRRLHGLLKEEWSTLKPGIDTVIIVKTDISGMLAAKLRAEIKEIIQKISA